MIENEQLWDVIAILHRSAPLAADMFQDTLDSLADSSMQRLMVVNSVEAVFDARARYDTLRELAEVWRFSEARLRQSKIHKTAIGIV